MQYHLRKEYQQHVSSGMDLAAQGISSVINLFKSEPVTPWQRFREAYRTPPNRKFLSAARLFESYVKFEEVTKPDAKAKSDAEYDAIYLAKVTSDEYERIHKRLEILLGREPGVDPVVKKSNLEGRFKSAITDPALRASLRDYIHQMESEAAEKDAKAAPAHIAINIPPSPATPAARENKQDKKQEMPLSASSQDAAMNKLWAAYARLTLYVQEGRDYNDSPEELSKKIAVMRQGEKGNQIQRTLQTMAITEPGENSTQKLNTLTQKFDEAMSNQEARQSLLKEIQQVESALTPIRAAENKNNKSASQQESGLPPVSNVIPFSAVSSMSPKRKRKDDEAELAAAASSSSTASSSSASFSSSSSSLS